MCVLVHVLVLVYVYVGTRSRACVRATWLCVLPFFSLICHRTYPAEKLSGNGGNIPRSHTTAASRRQVKAQINDCCTYSTAVVSKYYLFRMEYNAI